MNRKVFFTLLISSFLFFYGCEKPPEKPTRYLGAMLNTPNSVYIDQLKPTPHFIGYQVDWEYPNPKSLNKKILNKTALPYIIWEPQFRSDPNAMNLESISNGEWDQVLAQWASVIKALEYPVLIAFAPQVNNNHYPWHLTQSTDTAQTYIDAFQYVVTFFRDLDTLNVYWVWEISSQPTPKTIWNNAQNAYPGDEYVDWICLYGQNFGTEHTWSKWQPLENIVANSLKEIQHYQKPIALRVHTTDAGGSSQKWSNDIPLQLQSSLSSVQLLIISQNNYKHIAQSPLFKANLDNFQKIKAHPTNSSTELPHLDLPIPINLPQSITQGAYHWNGPLDLSATVQLKINQEMLTTIIELTDDHPITHSNKQDNLAHDNLSQDNLVLGDSIELIINDRHFVLNTKNNTKLWDLKNHKAVQSSRITYTKAETETSTLIQVEIPFMLFTDPKLEQFNIIINDFDKNKDYTKIKI